MRKICYSRFSTRQTSLIKDGQLAVESDVMVCIDYRMMCGYQAAYQSASEMFATYAYVANMYWRAQEMIQSSSGKTLHLLMIIGLTCSFLVSVYHFSGMSPVSQAKTNSITLNNKEHHTVPLIVFKLPRTGSSWFNQELNRYLNWTLITVVKVQNSSHWSGICSLQGFHSCWFHAVRRWYLHKFRDWREKPLQLHKLHIIQYSDGLRIKRNHSAWW